jgi:3'-phosphoadenosine 5'-phosphosulfate sulfotransferase (PAPS reductase)/FAD synthetase
MIGWGKLEKTFWQQYAALEPKNRSKFLKKYGLQKKDVPQCPKCKAVFFNCYCKDSAKITLHDERKAEYRKPFLEKLKHSQELVEKVLAENKCKQIFLAYSGGIDSECCVQLFKEAIMDGRVTVITADTLCEFPQTRKRWQQAETELGVKFTYARPDLGVSFPVMVKKVGWPLYARGHSDIEKRKPTDECCKNLKKKNMKKIEKQAGVLILGLRGEENSNRRKKTIQYGDYFYSKSDKQYHVFPIAFWSIEDVWEYQNMCCFNYNGIYDLTNCNKKGFYQLPNGEFYQIRTGCVWCPQSINSGYLIWLKEFFPRHYDVMINQLGLKNNVIWAQIQFRMHELKSKQYQICGAFQ